MTDPSAHPQPSPQDPSAPPPAADTAAPVAMPAAAPPAAARAGVLDWLFGAWVTGGSRPISKSGSFRYSVIATILAAGVWFYSSTIAGAPELLARYSPSVTRICLSFAAAFLVGFLVRKILKAVFIAGLLLAGLFFAAKLAGVKLDLSVLKETTDHAVEGTRSLAHRLGEVAKNYLPSTFAASVGLWRGGTRDSIK
ncbi:MAG: hypothetical protein U0637_15470 [Phycisphaerales bacterium]